MRALRSAAGWQLQFVESLLADVAVDDHKVVTLLALHEEFAVAVDHLAARGVLHLVTQHVARRQTFVLRVDELYVGDTESDDSENA